MYHVKQGPANQSYGIQVARLAGLPAQVLRTASSKLTELEQNQTHAPQIQQTLDFHTPATKSEVEQLLCETDVDDVTPKQALELLYQLKHKLQ